MSGKAPTRCPACESGEPCDFSHGLTGYNFHRCRCDVCKAAKRKVGQRYYNSGQSGCQFCKQGTPHEFEHGLSGYNNHRCRCDVCKAAKRGYHRNNQERDRQRSQEHYQRNRDQIIANTKKYAEENKEKVAEYRKRYYADNRSELLEYQRDYRNNEQTREKYLEGKREEYFRHRDQRKAHGKKRYRENRDEILERQHDYYNNRGGREIAALRHARNRDYISRQAKIAAQRRKAIPNPHNRKRWTAEEDATVLRKDLEITDIAYLLGRSYQAVSVRRRTLRKQGLRA